MLCSLLHGVGCPALGSENVRAGQVRPARNAGPVKVQAQYESNVYDTNLYQVTRCAAKIDERFAMLIPKVAIHNCIGPLP